MRGTKTVIERMQEADRIKETDRQLTELDRLRADNARLVDALEKAIGALEFYGSPETYFAISFLADPPCGEFAEDGSDTGEELGFRPGKRARNALTTINEVLGGDR